MVLDRHYIYILNDEFPGLIYNFENKIFELTKLSDIYDYIMRYIRENAFPILRPSELVELRFFKFNKTHKNVAEHNKTNNNYNMHESYRKYAFKINR